MKKLIIFLLLCIISILIGVKFIDFQLIETRPFKLNRFPFIISISFLITILIQLAFEKKFIFLSIFNFAWIFIVSSLALSFLFNAQDFEKTDYCFSQKVENYTHKKYLDKLKWTNENLFIKKTRYIMLIHQIKTIIKRKNTSFEKVYFNGFIICKKNNKSP